MNHSARKLRCIEFLSLFLAEVLSLSIPADESGSEYACRTYCNNLLVGVSDTILISLIIGDTILQSWIEALAVLTLAVIIATALIAIIIFLKVFIIKKV